MGGTFLILILWMSGDITWSLDNEQILGDGFPGENESAHLGDDDLDWEVIKWEGVRPAFRQLHNTREIDGQWKARSGQHEKVSQQGVLIFQVTSRRNYHPQSKSASLT